jgi:hypothetical protein
LPPGNPVERGKALNPNDDRLSFEVVRALISLADKKSAGMGVPAWGGAKRLPPLFLDLAVIPMPQPSRSVICHLCHSEAGRAEESVIL